MSAKYVYKQTEFAGRDGATNNLFTVGFYTPDDYWLPESDHESKEAAAARVHWLNGGLDNRLVEACDRVQQLEHALKPFAEIDQTFVIDARDINVTYARRVLQGM